MSSTTVRKYATRVVSEAFSCNAASRLLMAILETSPAAVIAGARVLDDTTMQSHALAYEEAKIKTPLEERFVIVCIVKQYSKISTIKAYREYTHAGLKEAKEFVEQVAEKRHARFGNIDYHSSSIDVNQIVKLAKGMKS